ncbi:ThuA domain-containing protein [Parapedobacter tibetensis]|uniref:ThuA domain-containing protein n=1 Tax=Parapedobacter tibetensis TaxID=2972951 RepID=UPI00214D3A7E|nr:ThuA domain-containing protein [Parapedobacter tibetensis]
MKSFFNAVSTKSILFFLAVAVCIAVNSCNKRSGKPRVLVFSKTAAFYHKSIPAGNEALLKLGRENGIDIDTTTNAAWFHEDSLAKYAAVVFLSTTGNVLNHYQEVAFERYIQAGGSFVGIHAASDTEYDWGWYGRLVGGYFKNHPRPQPATFHVIDSGHPATEGLPQTFTYDDEWYNFTKLSPAINVLITIDESSYEGGENGERHPMAWYHDYDGGRSFFTAFGHSPESFRDSLHLKHILGGLHYAIGKNHKLNYRKAKSKPVPERQRFVKTQLHQGGLFEPTEMTILPNFDILVAQRRGELMLYQEETREVKQVGFLDVYHKTEVPKVNAEEGFMGLAVDPDYEHNNYIYAFYSPADTSVNRLSRFVYRNDTLDRSTEQVVLQFYSQRDICCHTGGSIAFDSEGLLYLSTGDNSTPFDQPDPSYKNHGFAPLDSRPGYEQYDARRSAGNSNDLRGKILRIKVLPDGSYEIPDGNLFPAGQERTKPEIYVMGNRNPYRISVDQKNGFLYWGEVGPDANNDSLATRGPRGYDEVNQARQAGFFGWPFFVGDNYAYRKYNYATGQSGETFNPDKPENNSPNNTGIQALPPAQPAYVWYPYAASPQFPQVGTGGRNAMTGPVYYEDMFPKATRYPDYYDEKLMIYDWIRGWIKAVTMLPNGDFDKMEPFIEGVKFANPIDMEVGRDGRIYVLEYGSGWFSKNEDAGIARIDYISGNLPPQVGDIVVEKNNGKVPFTVKARVEATDYENDKLTYTWKIGEVTQQTNEPLLTHTLDRVGEYAISVTVEDPSKGNAESNPITVYAGNENPEVEIVLTNTDGFYTPGETIGYEVKVDDRGRAIDTSNLVISIDYIKGTDMAGASLGHQQVSEIVLGRSLMMASDCQSCHKIDEPSIGPSYMQVATRYKQRKDVSSYLVEKITQGGSGVWGEVAMAAHPDMKESEARQIVQWIMSLADDQSAKRKSLPAKGTFVARPPSDDGKQTVLRITAQYTNSPEMGIRPLSGSKTVDLNLKE